MFGIILAGGSGSRLWPLSRELYPKQLLNLCAEKSLLQSTFERLNKFIPAQNIISITNTKHNANVRMQLGELSQNSIILSEPISKNTAPAIAMGVKYIAETSNDDEIILVVPSDLQITNDEKFIQSVQEAQKLAEQGFIVTFGVTPDYAETGFGYIHCEDGRVTEFTEKPDSETAEKYIQNGNYFWNSGIFMFKTSTIINELEHYSPEIAKITKNLSCSEKTVPFTQFEKMPNISIDYAVMEKSKNIRMVELQSDWKDLGSWKSIYEVSPKDENNNVFVGHVLDKDSKNSFIYSSSKLVATIGLEDTVIVETEDAILACKKTKLKKLNKFTKL